MPKVESGANMSDPTPEERAAREIAEYIEEAWLQVSHLQSKGRLAFIEVAATRAIKAAVAAEREACANLCTPEAMGKEIVCPEECAAAIRGRQDGETRE